MTSFRLSTSFSILVWTALLVLAAACNGNGNADGSGGNTYIRSKPPGIGDVNRINVIADSVLLSTVVGDSLRNYYEQPYPLMPQPEPIYDLRYSTAEEFVEFPARRELRNYVVLVNLSDLSSPVTQWAEKELGEEALLAAREDYKRGTGVLVDRYATGQTMLFLMGEGPDELARVIAESFPAARNRSTKADLSRLNANVYQAGVSTVLKDSIQELFGMSLDIPQDYRRALVEDDFLWVRRDIREAIQNLILVSVPYTDASQVSVDSAILYRNQLAGRAVRTDTEGSVMSTNNRDLPVLEDTLQIDGRTAYAYRGVWEMTDDYMGGPFFTYLIPDTESGKLYIIDAFVYAPGSKKGKRNYMQQLETIVRSAKF